jgi:hypothetical protein
MEEMSDDPNQYFGQSTCIYSKRHKDDKRLRAAAAIQPSFGSSNQAFPNRWHRQSTIVHDTLFFCQIYATHTVLFLFPKLDLLEMTPHDLFSPR